MINAQHAHIYRIHTLHFIFGEKKLVKFYQYSPYQERRKHGPGSVIQVADSAYPEEEVGTG